MAAFNAPSSRYCSCSCLLLCIFILLLFSVPLSKRFATLLWSEYRVHRNLYCSTCERCLRLFILIKTSKEEFLKKYPFCSSTKTTMPTLILYAALTSVALASDNGRAYNPPGGWRSWNQYQGMPELLAFLHSCGTCKQCILAFFLFFSPFRSTLLVAHAHTHAHTHTHKHTSLTFLMPGAINQKIMEANIQALADSTLTTFLTQGGAFANDESKLTVFVLCCCVCLTLPSLGVGHSPSRFAVQRAACC